MVMFRTKRIVLRRQALEKYQCKPSMRLSPYRLGLPILPTLTPMRVAGGEKHTLIFYRAACLFCCLLCPPPLPAFPHA